MTNQSKKKCADAIRILSADAIQKAKSGHPGMPLGIANVAFELWAQHLKHNPKNVSWVNRDRFVLSSGHASMLYYSLLHLFGYGLTLEDIKDFRQENSKTPGHPEHGVTEGVEATTGPLGAGISMAVGLAMAEKHLASVFNRDGYDVIDHYTFVLCGDGCLMEGISSEALSLAGTLDLSKLIVLYDSNHITIEGDTALTFTEDVAKRMEAFGFQVLHVNDGYDFEKIGQAIEEAKADKTRPSFIIFDTEIGYGCPAKQGKANAHGEPLGEDNVKALRQTLSWEYDEPFFVPEEIYKMYETFAKAGEEKNAAWQNLFDDYAKQFPELKEKWDLYFANGLNEELQEKILQDKKLFKHGEKANATRSISGDCLNILKDYLPNLIGGSADLAPSNKVVLKNIPDFSKETPSGRNIHFGVREMAMAGIANGLFLHGGIRPFVSTFFVFSDYMKPMMRVAALMDLPVTYVLTHDSIGVGEDGPTHEPIEQLAMLRSMPNTITFRPADQMETAAAWFAAVTSKTRPVTLVLSRQNLPALAQTTREGALQGAYVLQDVPEGQTCQGIVLATGSEVSIALEAQKILAEKNIFVRVVSMPCCELFDEQPKEYQEKILPKNIRVRVAVEAGATLSWWKYVGLDGKVIGIDHFGASAPANVLFKKFGFTSEKIVQAVEDCL